MKHEDLLHLFDRIPEADIAELLSQASGQPTETEAIHMTKTKDSAQARFLRISRPLTAAVIAGLLIGTGAIIHLARSASAPEETVQRGVGSSAVTELAPVETTVKITTKTAAAITSTQEAAAETPAPETTYTSISAWAGETNTAVTEAPQEDTAPPDEPAVTTITITQNAAPGTVVTPEDVQPPQTSFGEKAVAYLQISTPILVWNHGEAGWLMLTTEEAEEYLQQVNQIDLEPLPDFDASELIGGNEYGYGMLLRVTMMDGTQETWDFLDDGLLHITKADGTSGWYQAQSEAHRTVLYRIQNAIVAYDNS